jgi:hypothetical protein
VETSRDFVKYNSVQSSFFQGLVISFSEENALTFRGFFAIKSVFLLQVVLGFF